MKSAIALMTCTLLLSACAQNSNFVRPAPDALVLGKSTYSEAVKLLGDTRFKHDDVTINGNKIRTVDYWHDQPAKFVGLNAPHRDLHLTFFQDVLVGDEFNSSFDEDSTRFDVDGVFRLVNGKSTRDDVIAALGKPSGEILYPLVREQKGSGLVYWYSEDRPAFIYFTHSSRLIVFLDARNVVTAISYRENDGKEQFGDHITSWPSYNPLSASGMLSY